MPNSEPTTEPHVAMPIARPGLALLRELVAVEARGGVRRRARNVEQDRGAAAAVDRADVRADQDQDRVARRHLDRQRRQQRDAPASPTVPACSR